MSIESTATKYDWAYGERIPADPDTITTTLPNATSVETAVFNFGKVQSRVEAEIFAVEELTIADLSTFTIELFWDKDADGTFSDSRVIASYAPSGAAQVISAGSTIGIITPETDVELYCKVKYTASGNLSSNTAKLELYPTA